FRSRRLRRDAPRRGRLGPLAAACRSAHLRVLSPADSDLREARRQHVPRLRAHVGRIRARAAPGPRPPSDARAAGAGAGGGTPGAAYLRVGLFRLRSWRSPGRAPALGGLPAPAEPPSVGVALLVLL